MQSISIIIDRMEQINRLKVVLIEQKRTGKWLAETLEKNEATVSCWCGVQMNHNLHWKRF